ncbi:MAG: heme-binding protein [Novosphingobium sp.]|nr:heme-binding protein [Novosphingobium sp.]
MGLTLDRALQIARDTLAEGERRGFLPLAVAVLDTAGQPLAILRDHRTSLHRADIAIGKAAGCLAMGFGGRELAKRAAAMPAFMTAVGSIFPKGIVPVPGGVLVRDGEGVLLGAVGVSGETSDNDEACALAALDAAGLAADTGA